MSKIFFTFSMIIIFETMLFDSVISAQEGWYSASINYSYGLHALFFTSSKQGYIANESGSIIVTTDGALNWTDLFLANNYHTHDLFFLNKQTGWMTTDNLQVFKTEDAGRSWKKILESTPESYYKALTSIHFINEMVGYAVGWDFQSDAGYSSIILKTTGGGSKWTPQSAGSNNFSLFGVFFINEDDGFICGENGNFYITVNGGDTWVKKDLGSSSSFMSLFFIDNTHGWIAGSGGTIFRTTDGGQNWYLSDNPSFAYLWSIHFANQDVGYACGSEGTILKSVNGGASWSPQVSGTTNLLADIQAVSADTVLSCGTFGTILKTTNGGIGTTGISKQTQNTPRGFILNQNYPNPFNSMTTFTFHSPKAEFIRIILYDLQGREVRSLFAGETKTGENKILINGNDLNSGIYFYTLKTKDISITKKCILIK
jgi:photosystem II stability/assembly factor-like uncharacterized protein